MERVLVLGASGLVGNALIQELRTDYDVYGTYNRNMNQIPKDKAYKLQVEDRDSIDKILEDCNPSIVISCLRGDFDNQLLIHEKVAKYLTLKGGSLYYCSTANVFDAKTDSPKYERDVAGAESDYGRFKIDCENLLESIMKKDNLSILRLPMIWGKDSIRLNDLKDKLQKNEDIDVYNNLYITNNTDVMLAKQIRYIIANKLYAKFHLATRDVVNHQDFMLQLIKQLGYSNPKIKEDTLDGEKYYLAVVSNRTDIPEEYSVTNKEIIDYLMEC